MNAKPKLDSFAEAFALAAENKGLRNVEIASSVDTSQAFVSQWRHGRRGIPADKAPHVARLLGVRPEQISEAYAKLIESAGPNEIAAALDASAAGVPQGHVSIPPLSELTRGTRFQRIVLPEFLVRQKIGATPIQRLRWGITPSDAMAPLIERGALVFIDIGTLDHASVINGETYAYTLWDRPDVRRVTIRKDHWTVRGYSKDSEYTDLEAQDLPSLQILGHVVGSL